MLFVGYLIWWIPFALWPVRKKIGWWLLHTLWHFLKWFCNWFYDLWWSLARYIARLINAPYEAAVKKMHDDLYYSKEFQKPVYESMLLNAGYDAEIPVKSLL